MNGQDSGRCPRSPDRKGPTPRKVVAAPWASLWRSAFRGAPIVAVAALTVPALLATSAVAPASYRSPSNWRASANIDGPRGANAHHPAATPASQTITFGALANETLADSPVGVSANASSGLAVSFTTTTPSVCTSGGVDGATITLAKAGICTVQASQAGDAAYDRAASVEQSFRVFQASQTITFGALANQTLADSPVGARATASSGLAVSFTTTTPSVCTSGGVDGATITLATAGICTVQANQAGDATYRPAPAVKRHFRVSLTSQTITFGPLANETLADSTVGVGATASSGLAVSFTTTTPSVCTSGGTDGATITLATAGICTVQANQAGDATYDQAAPVEQSFRVFQASQTLTFGALANKTLAQSPVDAGATASSGLAVSFTTTTPSVCTSGGTDGATITLATAGICTVQANQAGDAIYRPAPAVDQSFKVSKASQTITFGALANKTLADSPVGVGATASSGLAVSFTTTTPSVCTSGGTAGATITLATAGTCTVQASQAGDATYDQAAPVEQSFRVFQASQTLTFGALADETLADSPLVVNATASSRLAVSFTTTTPSVCTSGGTDGATITLATAGTCTVQASQAGDATYRPAPAVDQSFKVSKAPQTITFGALAKKTLAQSPVGVGATASSGLAVSFTTTTPSVCTSGGTDGATITLVTAGTCTVQARQAGDATYRPAPAVKRSFKVL